VDVQVDFKEYIEKFQIKGIKQSEPAKGSEESKRPEIVTEKIHVQMIQEVPLRP
jgi:prophage maintenance system killer protein